MTVHQNQPILELGSEFDHTRRILILIHGRGATAESMLPIAQALDLPGTRILIPQAAGNRWYPKTAFGPLDVNEPDLSSALQVIDDLVRESLQNGIARERILIGGFSQGACLSAEYLARNPDRFGGLLVFSGALIGPPEQPRVPDGDYQGMPVLIGGADQDPWIALDWMSSAADFFKTANAEVDLQIYPGMGHTINQDEIERARKILAAVT